MCLSNIYREQDEELLMTDVSRIRTEGEMLCIRNLFGEEIKVSGVITDVDFEENKVLIRCI